MTPRLASCDIGPARQTQRLRTGLRVVAFLSALGLAACDAKGPAELGPAELAATLSTGAASGHNLLLITLDTVRADHLGCYGHSGGLTPTIDKLAENGVVFRHAVTTVPLTLPAHSSLMTGLYAPEHGARHNGTYVLSDSRVTLAEVLKEHGYSTAAFIGAFVLDARFGLAQGFETYDDAVSASPSQSADSYNERPAHAVADAALEWLEARPADAGPFFVWVHFFDAHAPYEPVSPPAGRNPYEGEIAVVDAQMSRIVEHLEERGLGERTLIIVASDHGEGLGQHGEATHGMLLYEPTVHIPLVFSSPSLFPSAIVYGAGAASLVDVLPATLGLLGIPAPPGLDGHDLFEEPPNEQRAVHLETLAPFLDQGWAPLAALRRASVKLVRAPEMELYDLVADPGEQHNLYAEPDTRGKDLEAELEQLLSGWESPEASLALRVPMDEEQRARLEALGYVDGAASPPQVTLADPKAMMPVWQRIETADALCAAGRLDEATTTIEAVLDEQPGSATAWYTATRIYNRSSRPDLALESIRKAVALHPRSEGYVTLAQLSLLAGDEATFEESLAAAERLDAKDGGIWIARGDRLAIQKRFEEALEQFEHALEVDPYRSGELARTKIAAVKRRLGST